MKRIVISHTISKGPSFLVIGTSKTKLIKKVTYNGKKIKNGFIKIK